MGNLFEEYRINLNKEGSIVQNFTVAKQNQEMNDAEQIIDFCGPVIKVEHLGGDDTYDDIYMEEDEGLIKEENKGTGELSNDRNSESLTKNDRYPNIELGKEILY